MYRKSMFGEAFSEGVDLDGFTKSVKENLFVVSIFERKKPKRNC